jgi:hypothetical protein
MRSQPLPGEASRRRAEEQFKTTKKVNSETKANTPSRQAEAAKTARLRALRLAKEAADKDTANRGAAAAKARRSEPRRRVRRPQASTRRAAPAETNRFAQVSTFNMRAPDRSPAEICSTQVRSTQVGVVYRPGR